MTKGTCTLDGCETFGMIRFGMCPKHYERFRKYGDPNVGAMPVRGVCKLDDCDAPHRALGYCRPHYRRFKETGSPYPRERKTECVIDECVRPPVGRGWCRLHYNRWWYKGDPLKVIAPSDRARKPGKKCKRRRCTRRATGLGLCRRHWHIDYRRRRPDVIRAINTRRRALVRNAPVNDFTAAQWASIKAAYRQRCAYCGRARRLTVDHVVPLTRGGSHTASNIVPACQPCNSRKSNRAAPTYQPLLM